MASSFRFSLLACLSLFGCSKEENQGRPDVKVETPRECVAFLNELPSFSQTEKEIIEKYYPSIISKFPWRLSGMYLDSIGFDSAGYVFAFSSLSHLRSHECEGHISLVMDGSASIRVDTTTKEVEDVEP